MKWNKGKNIIFLTHDPGGYDVIRPLASYLNSGTPTDQKTGNVFYCLGPSASLSPQNESSEEQWFNFLKTVTKEHIVVTGTSWGNDVEARSIRECKEKGITTISILDYWSNYSARFKSLAGDYCFPNYLIVMDELAFVEAKNDGVPEHTLRILGHPGLDRWIRNRQLQVAIPHQLGLRMLILSQPLSRLYGNTMGFTEYSVLEDILQRIDHYSSDTIHIKFHPKDDPQLIERYKDLVVEGDLYDLLPQYDMVIGMNTIGLLYAALCGTFPISYQPSLSMDDLAITNKLNITQPIFSLSQLKQVIDVRRTKLFECQGDRYELNSSSHIWMDGKSTERIVAFLEKVGETV